MNGLLFGLVTAGPAYDWFTFLWWFVVFLIIFLLVKYLPKYVTTEEKRVDVVKIFAIVGLSTHLVLYFISYFQTGGNNPWNAVDTLFCIAPCNIMTWFLFLMFLFNKSKFRNILFTIGAYGGIIFGLITMFYPEFYPGVATCDFSISFWKSIVFHSIMVMTGSLLFAFKLVKPKLLDSLIMIIALLLGFYVYGYPLTLLAEANNINQDFLYVRTFPLQDIFSVHFAMILIALVTGIIAIIYEHFALKKEERSLFKIFKFFKNKWRLIFKKDINA